MFLETVGHILHTTQHGNYKEQPQVLNSFLLLSNLLRYKRKKGKKVDLWQKKLTIVAVKCEWLVATAGK